jgi:hypothetical protein
MHFAAHQRKQGRFTDAIRPDQSNFVSGKECQAGVIEKTFGAARKGEIGDANHSGDQRVDKQHNAFEL